MEFEDLSIVQKVIDALNKLFEPHSFELVLDALRTCTSFEELLLKLEVMKS